MSKVLCHFNPYAATHRACDVTAEMMAGQPLALDHPFFVEDEDESIDIPSFGFLNELGVKAGFKRNGGSHGSSARNAAYALDQFYGLQAEVGIGDAATGPELFRVYADRLVGRVKEDGEGLSSDYMRTSASYVSRMFARGTRLGLFDVDLCPDPVLAMLSDDDLDLPMADGASGVRTTRRNGSKAMPEAHWKRLAFELGPLLTGGWHPGMPSMRPRLAGETGLQLGARVREARLDAEAVMAVPFDGSHEGHSVYTLTDTKGGHPRPVPVPNGLLAGYRHYHGTERRLAVDALRRRLGASFVEPRTLFVNGLDAGWATGRAVTTATLQADIRDAVRGAKLTEPVKVPLGHGEFAVFDIPLYTFHSLRHTFAIWMYHARKHLLGDPFPWKYIASRLGHRSMAVTLDVYLDLGRLCEPEIGRILRDTFLAAVDWDSLG